MGLLNTINFITSHPLNNKNRISAVCRFVGWQLRSRISSGPKIHNWVNGSKFFVRRGETGLTGNIYTGLHEFPDMGFLLHVLRPEDLFIDVGANAGSYSILACAAIGTNGYAFEPVPNTFKRLSENMRINNLNNKVQCRNMGIGKEKGTLAFTSDHDTTNRALKPGEETSDSIQVEVSTLDDELGNATPALMKIDVEGFETPVLEGAKKTLNKKTLHSIIMELNGAGKLYGYDENNILAMMLDLGFKTYSYDPIERNLKSLDGKNLDEGNTLFIRDLEFVEERLKTAPKIMINGREF